MAPTSGMESDNLWIDRELYLFKRLGQCFPAGDTSRDSRAEMVRAAILSRNIADTEACRSKQNVVLSYRQIFRKTFGEELQKQESWL